MNDIQIDLLATEDGKRFGAVKYFFNVQGYPSTSPNFNLELWFETIINLINQHHLKLQNHDFLGLEVTANVNDPSTFDFYIPFRLWSKFDITNVTTRLQRIQQSKRFFNLDLPFSMTCTVIRGNHAEDASSNSA